ncbi:MAG TPA: hypothetical protein VFB07_10525 [Vicinamibacterales bacterium]|nr:hypothetical protein [Vicinamibacterales bacterium]
MIERHRPSERLARERVQADGLVCEAEVELRFRPVRQQLGRLDASLDGAHQALARDVRIPGQAQVGHGDFVHDRTIRRDDAQDLLQLGRRSGAVALIQINCRRKEDVARGSGGFRSNAEFHRVERSCGPRVNSAIVERGGDERRGWSGVDRQSTGQRRHRRHESH